MWSFFDSIQCITVDTASKRVKQLKQNLKENGVNNYKLIKFERASDKTLRNKKSASFIGILQHGEETFGQIASSLFINHVSIIADSYARGFRNVLILEDDARFNLKMTQRYLPCIINKLEALDWKIVNFGAMDFPCPFRMPFSDGLAIAPTPLLAHCYALSRSGMACVLRSLKPKMHIDKLYSNMFPVYFVANPPICFQSEAPGLFEQAIEKMPAFMQFLNEMPFEKVHIAYHVCMRAFEVVLIALIAFLVYLWLRRRAKKTR